jgi:beta-lactamase class D
MRKLLVTFVCIGGVISTPAAAEPACLLLTTAESGKVVLKQGAECATQNSPASTFKIALAAMAYDAGILEDEHTPAWPYKEEYAAWRESWKTTIDPTIWQRESVVWYSREITRRLGTKAFQSYVDRFDYGNRDLSGDPGQHNGLSNSWNSSSLKISPTEEVAFLQRLLNHQLPITQQAADKAISIVPQFPLANGWTVYGKTGAGFQPRPDGNIDRDRQFGWFVGWVQNGARKVIFAKLIKDDGKIEGLAGLRARDSFLADLPKLLSGL